MPHVTPSMRPDPDDLPPVGESLGAAASAIQARLLRLGVDVAGRAASVTRRTLQQLPSWLAPLLTTIRTGESLRQDLRRLVEELLAQPPADEPEQEATYEAINEAVADGLEHAEHDHTVTLPGSTDAVAWAITSLLMTLVMRAKDGEDTDRLVAVGAEALEELLGTPPPGRHG